MKDINKIILIGRLGADPTQKSTSYGAVVNFPMATGRKVKGQAEDGTPTEREETQWHRIVVWGKQGEACAQYLQKGATVFVEGALKTRKYEDAEGRERISVEVIADQVSFLRTMKRIGAPAEGMAEATVGA